MQEKLIELYKKAHDLSFERDFLKGQVDKANLRINELGQALSLVRTDIQNIEGSDKAAAEEAAKEEESKAKSKSKSKKIGKPKTKLKSVSKKK